MLSAIVSDSLAAAYCVLILATPMRVLVRHLDGACDFTYSSSIDHLHQRRGEPMSIERITVSYGDRDEGFECQPRWITQRSRLMYMYSV
ncbi:hypothetical protein BDM02DRAFT_3124104, partial [Thelephora ganbajun]